MRWTEWPSRRRWLTWGAAVAAQVAVWGMAGRLLLGWPSSGLQIVSLASLPIPIALVACQSKRLSRHLDALTIHLIMATGLSGLVLTMGLIVLASVNRVPTGADRKMVAVSMFTAASAGVLYRALRERLSVLANHVVYGGREAPDHVLRTFSSRLSRAVPLEELLLQVAESLRSTLVLDSAEIWTGSEGHLERAVSVPDAPPGSIDLEPEEEGVVAAAAMTGAAWTQVWVPQLLADRADAVLAVVPVGHSGRLLGLVVASRPPGGDGFNDEEERVLTELARQLGLTLHNLRLDSALQASLQELRRKAEELQSSRARIVAASDAGRRQIERNLHDGAQQHLIALIATLRLALQTGCHDPIAAKELLEQVGSGLQDAIQELRTLARGIYPPVLAERGLREALTSVARAAVMPTHVIVEENGRYAPDVEAAVYFCCLEALQNAAKHAGDGSAATVRVWEEAGALLFEVSDDGVGFDVPADQPPGAGFVNMADRVGAIGGSVGIRSSPGRGTCVSGRIPIRH